ncbi:hypothetical protein [Thermococcus celer]|uniref:hypothetical protein n=1 Tax=Thermococcus celer TaxID=2264 RepID=UPI0012FF7411|nr:hypothetical protein [Thermococcus celer]
MRGMGTEHARPGNFSGIPFAMVVMAFLLILIPPMISVEWGYGESIRALLGAISNAQAA